MERARAQKEISKFSCRPITCDMCEHRGLRIDPLLPVLVTTTDDVYRFWVHKECIELLADHPDHLTSEVVIPDGE